MNACPGPTLASQPVTEALALVASLALIGAAFWRPVLARWATGDFDLSKVRRRGTPERAVVLVLGVAAGCYVIAGAERQVAQLLHGWGACFVSPSSWEPGVYCMCTALLLALCSRLRTHGEQPMTMCGLKFRRPDRSLAQLATLFAGLAVGFLAATFSASVPVVLAYTVLAAMVPWLVDGLSAGEITAAPDRGSEP